MLSSARRATAAATVAGLLCGWLAVAVTPAAADTAGDDPDHLCAIAPGTGRCHDILRQGPPVDDPDQPVCRHRDAYVPCLSPERFHENRGWFVGDVVQGWHGWDYYRRDAPERIDDPHRLTPPTYGCWAWLDESTGQGADAESPGNDPQQPGGWYMLLCIGDQPYTDDLNLADLTGFHHEVSAWRETGAPTGDPVQAALNALAELEFADPVAATAPPPATGSLPLGMPLWLAVDDTDPAAWGPLTATGCDGPLCVDITAYVHQVEWHLGDGHTETCPAARNRPWELGMQFLDPTGHHACHYYYEQPSRDLPGGAYPVEVTTHWHTHWEAPTLGTTGGPLTHTRQTSTTIRVDEIQVLITR